MKMSNWQSVKICPENFLMIPHLCQIKRIFHQYLVLVTAINWISKNGNLFCDLFKTRVVFFSIHRFQRENFHPVDGPSASDGTVLLQNPLTKAELWLIKAPSDVSVCRIEMEDCIGSRQKSPKLSILFN